MFHRLLAVFTCLALLLVLLPQPALADISAITSDSQEYNYTQDPTPFETQFNDDGTKMYMLGLDNDTVYQYTLSSAYDVSTASYDTVSFSVSTQEWVPEGMFFKPDGTTMYIIGVAGDRVYQYTLSTPWDLSTAAYASKSSPSNSSNDSTTVKVHFKPDGTKLYMTGFVNGTIYQYSVSSAWDASTATYDSVSFSMFAQTSNTYATTFNANGTKLFGVGPSDIIYQYSLSTPWDISTASYDSLSYDANGVDTSLYGLTLKSDDTKLYMTGASNNKVYRYSIDLGDSTAPTVDTLSPADDAAEVAVDANLVITFDEAVDAETGDITLYKSDDTEVEVFDVTSDISGSGSTTITINPSSDLDNDTSYYVQIDATAFDDEAGNSYAGISDETTWTFTTVAAEGRAYVYGPNGWIRSGGDGETTPTDTTTDTGDVTSVDDQPTNEADTEAPADDSQQPETDQPATNAVTERLVRDSASGTLYLIDADGLRHPFLTEQVAAAYEGTNTVETLATTDLATYPLGTPVLYPAGSLVKFTTGPEVFLVTDDNTLQWIINEEVFYSYGYSFADLYRVADSFWTFYQRGADITE